MPNRGVHMPSFPDAEFKPERLVLDRLPYIDSIELHSHWFAQAFLDYMKLHCGWVTKPVEFSTGGEHVKRRGLVHHPDPPAVQSIAGHRGRAVEGPNCF